MTEHRMILMDTNERLEIDTFDALASEIRGWCDAMDVCDDDTHRALTAAVLAWSAAEAATLVAGSDGAPTLWLEPEDQS